MTNLLRCSLPVFALLIAAANFAGAQESDTATDDAKKEELQRFSVADGYLFFDAPASWKKVKPKVNFIHAEFDIPKQESDPRDGRITFSQVGGSVDANLKRWIDQFIDIDAKDEEQVKRMKQDLDGREVELIRIKGTFVDSAGGPFGPKTERKDYVLMGAAIEIEDGKDRVYIKAYGPSKTMEANHGALEKMLKSMQVVDG